MWEHWNRKGKKVGDKTENMNSRNMQRAKQNNNTNSITMFRFNIS